MVLAAGPTRIQDSDRRDPVVRLRQLFDPGTLRLVHEDDDTGVAVVRGRVAGGPVIAYCTDARIMGGALGADGCRRIVAAIQAAVDEHCPVVGVWHSGGARLSEGVAALDGVGRMFAAMVHASGRVPQISVVLGPAAGGAAYGPALTDVVVMSSEARVFVTGPEVVRRVTGEQVDMESLGGPDTHGRRSGVAHVVVPTESDAFARARALTTLLGQQGTYDVAAVRTPSNLSALLPQNPNRAYDVRPLVRAILDPAEEHGFLELQPRWAPNVVVGLGRLAGRTIGVVANNPLRKGGCLDALGAEKAAMFVRRCDSFGVPLLVLVDVPGYLPGLDQEWTGVVRRGAKLLHAFAEAVVPRVTLVTRKSYGGAYIAMNSRALGASAVLAWPQAELAVMGAEAAVAVMHRRTLAAAPDDEREALRTQLIKEYEQDSGGVRRALSIGVVDEVIDPSLTRSKVVTALIAAPARRGAHGNIPL